MWTFDQNMMTSLSRNWWMLLVRGIAALLFGVLAYIYPGSALAAMILIYGVYALVDGIFAIIAAIGQIERHRPWGFLLLSGVVSILAGLIALFYPGLTAVALLFVMAFWAILRGIFEVSASIQLRKILPNDWALALAGILSLLFGILLLINPAAGILAVVWLVATYAIIYGIIELALAVRVHHASSGLAGT